MYTSLTSILASSVARALMLCTTLPDSCWYMSLNWLVLVDTCQPGVGGGRQGVQAHAFTPAPAFLERMTVILNMRTRQAEQPNLAAGLPCALPGGRPGVVGCEQGCSMSKLVQMLHNTHSLSQSARTHTYTH